MVAGVGNWDIAPLTPLPLAPETKGSKTSVKAPAAAMAGASFVRLDVDIKATIGSVTKTVLAFKQLYSIDSDGRLKAQLWVIDDFSFKQPSGGGPPVRAPGTSTRATRGCREGTGLHPLLRHDERVVPAGRRKPLDLRIARIFINAEFVDATELWWATHPRETTKDIFNPNAVPQYLNPTLGGRCEHLRVLVWTGGGLPMIWFAVIPDGAVSTLDAGSADVVFFRPPAGINSFVYSPNAAGFANPNHGSTTMSMLARYLLSARPLAELSAAGISDARTLRQFADQIQPNTPNPTSPSDPSSSIPQSCCQPLFGRLNWRARSTKRPALMCFSCRLAQMPASPATTRLAQEGSKSCPAARSVSSGIAARSPETPRKGRTSTHVNSGWPGTALGMEQ